MRRLIHGDIRRILLKIGFYILPVIYFVLSLTDITEKVTDFEPFYESLQIVYKYIFPFVIGIPIFVGVYADELKVGAMQIAIGRGLSRKKIVLSKFFDCVLLTIVLFFLDLAFEFTLLRIYMLVPTSLQIFRMNMLMVSACLKTIGAMAFSAIFVYLTWNSSLGLVVELLSLAFAEPLLDMIQVKINLPVLDISYMGQVDQTCANIAAGANWILPLCVVFAYVIVFNLIGIVIFGRKELEL